MKRRTFIATIVGEDRDFGKSTQTFAWNGAIRATEALVRELARSEGQTYTGEPVGQRDRRQAWHAARTLYAGMDRGPHRPFDRCRSL